MKDSTKFWLLAAAAFAFAAWLFEVPVWWFPVVAAGYIAALLSADWWQRRSALR